MHEPEKLKEARYFLAEMHAKQGDPNAFVHLLSAFLSAARSVAQYACKEAKAKTGGQAWYDSQVAGAAHPNILLFKNQRNFNIHRKPVAPRTIFNINVTTTLHLTGSADYRVSFLDDDDNPVTLESPPPEPNSDTASTTSVRYEFHKRPNDDLLDLCKAYVKELEALVQDGQSKSFLTP